MPNDQKAKYNIFTQNLTSIAALALMKTLIFYLKKKRRKEKKMYSGLSNARLKARCENATGVSENVFANQFKPTNKSDMINLMLFLLIC